MSRLIHLLSRLLQLLYRTLPHLHIALCSGTCQWGHPNLIASFTFVGLDDDMLIWDVWHIPRFRIPGDRAPVVRFYILRLHFPVFPACRPTPCRVSGPQFEFSKSSITKDSHPVSIAIPIRVTRNPGGHLSTPKSRPSARKRWDRPVPVDAH